MESMTGIATVTEGSGRANTQWIVTADVDGFTDSVVAVIVVMLLLISDVFDDEA